MDQLLIPPYNELYSYRLYGTGQYPGDYSALDPGISLAEYTKNYPDAGYHWDSKVLTEWKDCFSIFPTLDMLKEAKRIYRYPKYAYLMRYGAYPITPLFELSDICSIDVFWQN